mgnify:FL=1
MAEVRRDMEPYMQLSLITFLMRIQSTGSSNCAMVNNEYMYDSHGNRTATSYSCAQGLYRDGAAKRMETQF